MANSSSSNWMQSAVKRPGAFTAKAQSHKMGTQRFASEVLSGKVKSDTRTKRQASLAETFAKLRGGK